MTVTPQIFNWRPEVAPINQRFRAGGTSIDGGITTGGVSVQSPEPGGRAELDMDFVTFANESTNREASWTISRILNGNVMRVPIYYPSVQLVSNTALGITGTETLLWNNNLPWANLLGWEYRPSAAIDTGGLEGATSFVVTTGGGLQNCIERGHVLGFCIAGYDWAHVVLDVSYNSAGDRATCTVEPPLRRDVATTDRVLFRPSMLATCVNARDVAGQFRDGQFMQLNAARFVEWLL